MQVFENGNKCTGEKTSEKVFKWDKCTQFSEGLYIKVKGATALKAAAVALVAFIGT